MVWSAILFLLQLTGYCHVCTDRGSYNALHILFFRNLWVRPRPRLWWDYISQNADDQEWKKHFRMRKATFQLLVDALSPYLFRQDTNYRQVLTGYFIFIFLHNHLLTSQGYPGSFSYLINF